MFRILSPDCSPDQAEVTLTSVSLRHNERLSANERPSLGEAEPIRGWASDDTLTQTGTVTVFGSDRSPRRRLAGRELLLI